VDDADKKTWLAGLLAAGMAALGIWGIRRWGNTSGSAEEETQALKELAKLGAWRSDPQERQRVLARLSAARMRRRIQERHDAGYPTNPGMDQALEDIARARGADDTQAMFAATERLLDEARKTRGTPQRPSGLYPYCEGAGSYICFSCQASGRKRRCCLPLIQVIVLLTP
jgi:hypothetical protein